MKYIDKPKRYEKEDYIITAIILNRVLNGVSFQLESLIFNNITPFYDSDLKMVKNAL